MRLKLCSLVLLAISTFSASAKNDLTGVVSEVHTRSGNSDGDHSIYFRLEVDNKHSTFAHCLSEGTTVTWHLNPDSVVFQQQYNLVMRSYTEQLPVRVSGQSDVCNSTHISSDKVFELSPIHWDYLLNRSKVAEKHQ
ncbi:hypothetical protein CWB96_05980 [Pseudoalteromonas citrea]|uniref:Uncharacterized protein n=1 Tax=Pseudoalteromonas citrea TaxID=43655 RepID=A0A5S3XSR8_9GAMM|nr:hypothetical protein [Pseudoalteromonas citrea]TMP44365.1 hypothetical protein CWB97_06685 [Pseudoalteromonas citrea]TMP60740.1 hypothetical protein CWB96_05980 [Pseudoalteromonas citrea]